ncbi:hypothetical protein ALC57_14463 [Trachymyrmex cornetzi]|uniref:Uncharacterized protein n=1 Tax=Trachymyrmex cornetzi TaxID=471704 RepID=A0A195DKP3_9HYME|nr:hypothetical protein ALC57_14463 [Trachymyrmex cornetzi]
MRQPDSHLVPTLNAIIFPIDKRNSCELDLSPVKIAEKTVAHSPAQNKKRSAEGKQNRIERRSIKEENTNKEQEK